MIYKGQQVLSHWELVKISGFDKVMQYPTVSPIDSESKLMLLFGDFYQSHSYMIDLELREATELVQEGSTWQEMDIQF